MSDWVDEIVLVKLAARVIRARAKARSGPVTEQEAGWEICGHWEGPEYNLNIKKL